MVAVEEVTRWCLQMPDVVQQPHFHKASFRVKKKIFATLDVNNKKLVVKLSAIDQSVFCGYNSNIVYPVSGAWGKQGWTFIELPKVRKSICRDAIETAYHSVLESGKKKS